MDIKELIGSDEYKAADERITLWKKQLQQSDAKEAASIEEEKDSFFRLMRSKDPSLYSLFEIEDKELSEKINLLLGRDPVLND